MDLLNLLSVVDGRVLLPLVVGYALFIGRAILRSPR